MDDITMTLGYLEVCEESTVDDDPYSMETMLYGAYPWFEEVFSEEIEKEWIALWESYAKIEKWKRNHWEMLSTEGDILENIVAKLERLKKKRPDLFHEIFDKDFVMKLIVEIGINGSENETDWESVKLFNKWIRDNLKDQVTEEDVWNSFLLLDKIGTKELICYIALWRCCFQKKVFVDLEKNPKLIQFFTSIRYWEIPIERKKRLFRVISGVKGSTKEILDDFMDTTDRELMYLALKKNFITVGLTDEAIDWAIDRKKLELIPLLILKKHGEWPEEELFKENKHV